MKSKDEAVKIAWLRPLFTNAGGFEVCVGLGEDTRWYILYDGPKVDPQGINRELLPLMQAGYGGTFETAYRMMEERLQEIGISTDLVENFPFAVPVRTAIHVGLPFWVGLAAAWRPYVSLKTKTNAGGHNKA